MTHSNNYENDNSDQLIVKSIHIPALATSLKKCFFFFSELDLTDGLL